MPLQQRLHHAHLGSGRDRPFRLQVCCTNTSASIAPKLESRSTSFWRLAVFRPDNHHEPFSMAICAIKTSAFRNAVSSLHRQVSQEMWQELWPKLPVWEVPITSITNGVHLLTWLNGDLAQLYDHILAARLAGALFRSTNLGLGARHPQPGALGSASPPETLPGVLRAGARAVSRGLARKASSAEQRRLSEVLDPDTFTIGFARRFATYKRATLLFRDIERLKRLSHQSRDARCRLSSPAKPIREICPARP